MPAQRQRNQQPGEQMDVQALRERFAAQALETREAGPEALAIIMREDLARWSEVIQRLGVRQD